MAPENELSNHRLTANGEFDFKSDCVDDNDERNWRKLYSRSFKKHIESDLPFSALSKLTLSILLLQENSINIKNDLSLDELVS